MTDARTTETYLVPEGNVARLEEKLTKLAKRAARLGVLAPEWVVGQRIEKEFKDQNDRKGFRVFHEVTLISAPVQLADWTFIGTLDHTTEAGVIVRAVPGVELKPDYRFAAPVCDHCGFERRRTETFILRHADGSEKQVGRQCLADFLGADPKLAAKSAEFSMLAAEAADDEKEWNGSCRAADVLTDFLGWVALCIRTDGWVSRGAERNDHTGRTVSTVTLAGNAQYAFSTGRSTVAPEAADYELGQAAVNWARELRESGNGELNDYLHNLTTVCAGESVADKNKGIAASVIPAFRRELEKVEMRKAAAKSVHFGTVGKRQVFNLTVAGVRTFESQYGVRTMVKFLDAAGNVAVWWASGDRSDYNEGEAVTVKATVKAHETYNGSAQTVLARVADAAPVKRAA